MGVPDKTFFGVDENNKGVTYGEVKESKEERRIELLEYRIKNLLIKQINELVKNPDGSRKVYSPFPLAILTCIAIETLGQVFFFYDKRKGKKNQNYGFVKVINYFDTKFSRPLSIEFKEKLKRRFPTEKIHKSKNISEIIYTYFRNTFIHGYRGRAVYLEESIENWLKDDGYFVINPNWFWNKWLEVFDQLLRELKLNKESNNPFRVSCNNYINDLIK